jgi:DNA polymerase-1
MNKLLIIDGHNLLFQMFFGMPARILNRDGKAIQGTLGFVGALLKIIRMTQPTHVVVLFDSEQVNERCELDEQYKANRPDYSAVSEEENPFSQLADIWAALDHLNIRYAEVRGFETDDVIASYALSYGQDMEIVISSFDSDFFQLINDNVKVLRYRGEMTVICDCEYIKNKLGIFPNQYADFKSLTGDTADNIKGADKIGPKTAAQLLCEFGTLDSIIENAQRIAKPSVRESIIRNTERLKTNQKLIKLDNQAPLPFTADELRYEYNGITTNEVLAGIGLR